MRRYWWYQTGFMIAGAIAAGTLLLYQTPGKSHWLPPCWFHSITGLYCTGCGITRAAYALVHGEITRAVDMNLLAVMAIPVAAILWVDKGLNSPEKWRVITEPMSSAKTWMLAIIAFTVARNLPWQPFAWLAPG